MKTKVISIEQNRSLNVAINYKEDGQREQSININTDLDRSEERRVGKEC